MKGEGSCRGAGACPKLDPAVSCPWWLDHKKPAVPAELFPGMKTSCYCWSWSISELCIWNIYLLMCRENIIEKVGSSCPDPTLVPTLCWGSMARSRDTTSCQWNITSESPSGKSFEPEFSFPMVSKRDIFLTNGDNFTGMICTLTVFEWKMRKRPYGPFLLRPT